MAKHDGNDTRVSSQPVCRGPFTGDWKTKHSTDVSQRQQQEQAVASVCFALVALTDADQAWILSFGNLSWYSSSCVNPSRLSGHLGRTITEVSRRAFWSCSPLNDCLLEILLIALGSFSVEASGMTGRASESHQEGFEEKPLQEWVHVWSDECWSQIGSRTMMSLLLYHRRSLCDSVPTCWMPNFVNWMVV